MFLATSKATQKLVTAFLAQLTLSALTLLPSPSVFQLQLTSLCLYSQCSLFMESLLSVAWLSLPPTLGYTVQLVNSSSFKDQLKYYYLCETFFLCFSGRQLTFLLSPSNPSANLVKICLKTNQLPLTNSAAVCYSYFLLGLFACFLTGLPASIFNS